MNNSVNDVELSVGESPGMGFTKVVVNGTEIRGVVGIDLSGDTDSVTQLTLTFFARVNQPKVPE